MGLKKIEIKKINNKGVLKVTYSKRRKGLFNKADEFCKRTGAQIAIITFSPGMKPMTFGNPSVESVIYQYERQTAHDKEIPDAVRDLHEVGMRDEGKKMLEGMGLNELKEYAHSIEEQRNRLAWQIKDRKRRESRTDLIGMNASSELKQSVKVGENTDIEKMKRRESRTRDFLSCFS